MPKVSIVFSFYNDEKYLDACISSILAQTMPDFELVILDNGSRDSSLEIVEKYMAQDTRIKLIRSNHNVLPGAVTLKKMLEETSGEYIKLFCADDVLFPTCLAEYVAFLDQNPSYLGCFSHLECIREDGTKLNDVLRCQIKPTRYDYLNHMFYSYNPFTLPSACIRRHDLLAIKLDSRLVHFFDASMWFHLLLRGDIHVFDKNLVYYRKRDGEGNISNTGTQNKIKAFVFELHVFYELFFSLSSFDELVRIFPDSHDYINRLDVQFDLDMLPFVVGLLLFNSENYTNFYFGLHRDIALLKLYDVLNDDVRIQKAYDKFGISVDTLKQMAAHYHEGLDLDYAWRDLSWLETRSFFKSKRKARLNALRSQHIKLKVE